MNDRETQINALTAAIYTGSSNLEHARKEAEGYILRAEQRVREEMGKDSDRLDWVSSTLIEMNLLVATSATGRRRFVKNATLSGPLLASDFRMSIDAAREAGE